MEWFLSLPLGGAIWVMAAIYWPIAFIWLGVLVVRDHRKIDALKARTQESKE